MQNYELTLALRFWHPSLDPSAITAQLGISPSYSAKAGEPRFTPKGTPLGGVHRESYWHAEPLWQGRCDSNAIDAEQALLRLLPQLAPHAAFIRNLISSGGRGHIQISSHGSGNYAFVFPPTALASCASLALSLVHDVYAIEQSAP